jgi:hypothetical protein
MSSTPDPTPTEPNSDPNSVSARADEQLAHAYQQLQIADEQLARIDRQFSKLEHDDERRRQWRGRPALRGLVGLLLAACIGAAALIAHSSYGETARQMIADALASAQPQIPARPSEPEREPEPAGQVVTADTLAPSAPAAPAASQPVAPTTVALPPEVTDLLQTMAHDVATLQQGSEQLKTNLAQVGRDNARAVDELKASQEQMARLIAAASEQKAQPQTSATLPTAAVSTRTAAGPVRKPATAAPSQQFRSRMPAPLPPPVLLEPDDE